MRKIGGIVLALTLAAFSVHADEQSEHLEHLRMMMHAMSSHGPVIPQPESIIASSAVSINITAKQGSFTPSFFAVNQGDVVTINVSVPSNDGSSVGHGILMESYITGGINVSRGSTRSVTFTATTPGTFGFVCTQSSCGTYYLPHTSMVGQMVVNAVSNPAPTISSVFPTSGSTGGGTTVIVSGSHFQTSGTTTVKFDTPNATSVNVTSSTSISVVTPAHTAGTASVSVTNPDGQRATLSSAFTYATPGPSISSVSPNTGSSAGGTQITITGSGFQNGASVTIGGVAATNVTFVNSTSINVVTPAHAAGTVSVTVTNPNSQSATLANAFNYTNPGPSVTFVTPNSGSTGGGTAITITGSGFQNGASVTIGGVPATNVTVVNSTSINVVTPAHAAGTVSVTVTNPDSQSATLSNAFNYTNPGLTLTSVTPNSGSTGGGTALTITGSGFQNGAGVTIGGVPAANVTVVNSTTITATTPLGPANEQAAIPKDVVVTNPDGTRAARSGAFTYFVPPLTVGTISPSIGNVGGGTVVTIIGTGFTTTVESLVTFGGVAASNVSIVDAVTMQATAPAHAAGTVDVVLTAGNSSVTKASAFTYQNTPRRRRVARH